MTLPIIKRYLIALNQYKWLPFVIVTLTTSAAGLAGSKAPPPTKYLATGLLAYTAPPVIISEVGTEIINQGQQLGREQLLTSKIESVVLQKVQITSEQLRTNWGIYQPEHDKNTIRVYFRDLKPEVAETTVNIMMAEMVEQSRLMNTSRLRAIINEIEKRLPEITADLKESEQALEEYEKREGVSILATKSGALPEAITNNEHQQRQTVLQLEGVQAQIDNIEQQLGLEVEQAYIALSLAADPIIAQLRVQLYNIESQLQLLRKNFRDQHPNVIELIKQQQAAEEQLQQRASEVLGGNGVAAPLRNASQIRVDASLDPARQQLAQTLLNLSTQKETLERQLESLAITGQELREEFTTLPNKQQEYNRLAQQVGFRKTLYDTLQSKLLDAHAAVAETASSLIITQMAQISSEEPPQKNLLVLLAMGGVGGIGASAGLIFVLGMLNGKYLSGQEIRVALEERDIPLLEELPQIRGADADRLPFLLSKRSPYLECYEQLRSRLICLGKQPPKVILITSAMAAEGKTLCAYNLAIAGARAGKRTLLIEADFRCGSQVEGVQMIVPPLARVEPLRYYGDLNECLRRVPGVENLSIIASPGPVTNPARILESSELERLLVDVRHRFDWVILDAPAISANNDVFILTSEHIDGVILVSRPHYTTTAIFTEVLEQLTEEDEEEENAKRFPLLGVIINDVDDLVVISPEDAGSRTQMTTFPSLTTESPSVHSKTNGNGHRGSQLAGLSKIAQGKKVKF